MKHIEFFTTENNEGDLDGLFGPCIQLTEEFSDNEEPETPDQEFHPSDVIPTIAHDFEEHLEEFIGEALDQSLVDICELAATIDVRMELARARKQSKCPDCLLEYNEHIAWCEEEVSRLREDIKASGFSDHEIFGFVKSLLGV